LGPPSGNVVALELTTIPQFLFNIQGCVRSYAKKFIRVVSRQVSL